MQGVIENGGVFGSRRQNYEKVGYKMGNSKKKVLKSVARSLEMLNEFCFDKTCRTCSLDRRNSQTKQNVCPYMGIQETNFLTNVRIEVGE